MKYILILLLTAFTSTIMAQNIITVNGHTYTGGRSVSISNKGVYIDGHKVDTPDKNTKEINVVIQGNIQTLQVDNANQIGVNGNVGTLKTQSGDVICGNVTGNINTMSGDVNCGNIGGSVETMSGDISRK